MCVANYFKSYMHIYIFTCIHTNIYIYMQLKMYARICNGYPSWKWTQPHEFKSRTRLIAFHIAVILLGKVKIQLFFPRLWVNGRAD